MDTAWEYHNGESERRMGLALHDRRDQVTLMTKVCARDRKTAEEQLHESLRRLQFGNRQGARLRAMMPWIAKNKLVDKAKN